MPSDYVIMCLSLEGMSWPSRDNGMPSSSVRYLRRAEEARIAARSLPDGELRQLFFEIAQSYEDLATDQDGRIASGGPIRRSRRA